MKSNIKRIYYAGLVLLSGTQIWLMFLQQTLAGLGSLVGLISLPKLLFGKTDRLFASLLWLFIVFTVWRSIGYFYSPDRAGALDQLQYPLMGMIFISIVQWKKFCTPKSIRFVLNIWFWSAVVSAFIGILKYFFEIESRIGPPLGSTIPNPVDPGLPPLGSYSLYAKYLAMTLLFLGTPIFYREIKKSWKEYIGVLIMLGGLFLTFSRSCLLAVIAVFGVILLKTKPKMLAIFALIGLALLLSIPYGRDRIRQSLTAGEWSSGRVEIWSLAINKMDIRIISGYGLSSLKSITTSEERSNLPDPHIGDWHNQYLQILMENGIIGLLIFMLLVVFLFRVFNDDNNPLKIGQAFVGATGSRPRTMQQTFLAVNTGWRSVVHDFHVKLCRLIRYGDTSKTDVLIGHIHPPAFLWGILILSLFETFLNSPSANIVFWILSGVAVGDRLSDGEHAA